MKNNIFNNEDLWSIDSPFPQEAPAPTSKESDVSHRDSATLMTQIERQPETDTHHSVSKTAMTTMPISVQDAKTYAIEAQRAMSVVDDVVSKGYLTRLGNMQVVPVDEDALHDAEECTTIFKVELMAYEKDEYATDKFISAFSAMTFAADNVFLIVDGFADHTDFYIGIKNNSELTTSSIADTMMGSLQGQFPGIKLTDLSQIEVGKKYSAQHRILRDFADAKSVSSFSGIPTQKGKTQHDNNSFIQGIEKFSDAMQGRRYTAIILAKNQTADSIVSARTAYESLYSQLSCMASQQLAYSTNESIAHALTRSQGSSNATSHSESNGTGESVSENENISTSKSTSHSTSTSKGESKQNYWGKASQLASPLMEAGAILTCSGIGAPIGLGVMGIGAALGLGGIAASKTKTKNESESNSESVSNSQSRGTSHSTNTTHNESNSTSHTDTITDSEGNTSTVGQTKNFTLTIHNKKVEDLLKRIDKQIDRIDAAESGGLWSTCTYFLSYDDDYASAQTGAAIFRSITSGDESGVESSAINTWPISNNNQQNILRSLATMEHPMFVYPNAQGTDFSVEGTSLISSKELSILMGLPRKSVPGLPVVDNVPFGKEVVSLGNNQRKGEIAIGCIYDHGAERNLNKVELNAKSMTGHTFVTGSTGSGKSEAVYRLIERAKQNGVSFLVIEPAKGEYKNVFGDANVFGTNPILSQLIRINPFRFPNGIHILEHIDNLIDIFNVCWPMYAAMPAVLKKAILRSYENCGWLLYESRNTHTSPIFPSFADLLVELERAINESKYSEEVKGNYTGSLVTRVESLTNGINGEIFSYNEVDDNTLFDQNTIIDLSRIGSQETKSLIMGLLILRLNEYRMVNAQKANEALKHLTVIEEAHNLLQRVSTEQSMEGSNMAGKSVELLINSIAQMRSYGEGFIIVDQSPTSVHQAAIKNTNTKIVMRLPDGEDRQIAGKAMALNQQQIEEIAKLPTGVAVVYQNDWMHAVKAKLHMMTGERIASSIHHDMGYTAEKSVQMEETLKLLLATRMSTPIEINADKAENDIKSSNLTMALKGQLLEYVAEYRNNAKLKIWNNDNFVELAHLITEFTGTRNKVAEYAEKASSFDELDQLLTNIVKNSLKLPDYMDLALRQSWLRDYSTLGVSQLKIYNAWIANIKKRGANEHRES